MTPPLGDPFAPTEPEWLVKAQAGIKTTTDIPRIIPPLPEGDTKDMKVWKEYWKHHDTIIRKQEGERVLDALMDWSNNEVLSAVFGFLPVTDQIDKRIFIRKIKSLREES